MNALDVVKFIVINMTGLLLSLTTGTSKPLLVRYGYGIGTCLTFVEYSNKMPVHLPFPSHLSMTVAGLPCLIGMPVPSYSRQLL
ncbi:uncharacterized protein BDZ83DRAFT_433197 [Colletotrichum acutatum]|uniref:Uncharacterized protein n=1 Tax=Glomerella acutata TaxID=27357 RepID=A0AAD8XEZ3_GLOAC|nr:uncharacterized protein BDZ83DRAFT_433197 [Colletotrichum acutatum]KAK1722278.1 hypothetical protein BDZ83DRAFT_433197 [Colletotrichum acutatum]